MWCVCVCVCRYGVGYHLTLVKGPSCDTQQLRELIMSTVPGSELASDVSAELTFLLPFTSSQHFPSLLDTLERQYLHHSSLSHCHTHTVTHSHCYTHTVTHTHTHTVTLSHSHCHTHTHTVTLTLTHNYVYSLNLP